MSTKATGHVKWFNDEKGYGFITRDDSQEDIFVHFRAIVSEASRKTLFENQRVEFDINQSPKGLQAENVLVTEEA